MLEVALAAFVDRNDYHLQLTFSVAVSIMRAVG